LPDGDARWLFDAFNHSPARRDIKISRGTHLMHLETMRSGKHQLPERRGCRSNPGLRPI